MSRFAKSRLPPPTSLPHPQRPQSPPSAPPCPNQMEVLDSSWYVSCIDHIAGPNPEGEISESGGGHFGADDFCLDGATLRRNTWTVEDSIADQSMPVLSADEVTADEISADEVSVEGEGTCLDDSEVVIPPVVTNRVGRSGTFRTFRPEGARPPGPDIARGEDEGGETRPPLGSDVMKSPPPEVVDQPLPLPPLEIIPIDPAPNFVPKKSKHSAVMERLAASIAKDRSKPKKEVKSKLNQTTLNPTLVQPEKIAGKITFLKKLSSFEGGNRFAFTKKTTQNPSNSALGNGDPYSNGFINGSKLNSRRESFASSLTSSSISENKPKPRPLAQPVQAKTQHKSNSLKASKENTLNHTLTNGKLLVASYPKSKANGTLTRTNDYSSVQSKIKPTMVTRSRPARQKATDSPKTLLLRRQMNNVMVGIQALAIVVDHQIERERKNSLWHRREMEKMQIRARVELEEVKRNNETYMAEQMTLFDTKLEYLERVKENEMIELQNRMNQDRNKLIEDQELALKSVQDDCQRTLIDKETAHQVEKSLLKAESLRLNEECQNLTEKYQRTELALTRSAEKKLDLARATYQTQRAEIESLTAVLEMKNGEIHKLRAHNLSLERKCEELNETREELERLKMKTEELQAIIDNKAQCEQVLSEEKVQLRQAYEKESKVNQRLSLELEEMSWKLKQNKTSKRSSTSSIPPNANSNSCMSRSVESSPFNKHSTPYKIHRANNEGLTSQSLILNDSGDAEDLDGSYFPIVHMYVGKQSFTNVPLPQKHNCDNCHQNCNRGSVVDSEDLNTLTDTISPYNNPQTSLDVVNH